jgi:hypothetical protein
MAQTSMMSLSAVSSHLKKKTGLGLPSMPLPLLLLLTPGELIRRARLSPAVAIND